MSLKHIEINIWKVCNNRCKFCMSFKSKIDRKFVENSILKNKIKKYAEKGYNSIGFLWGDVSIYPHLYEIINFCKENWFKNINLVSNGMRFQDKEFLKSILDITYVRLNISIHSHINNIEDYITSVPWWLKKKLDAIDNFNILKSEKGNINPLSINMVINKINYTTIIESVLYFFYKKNISDIRINFIRLSEDVKDYWDEFKISYTEVLPYIRKLIYISLKYKIRVTFDTIPPCIFYKLWFKNKEEIVEKFSWESKDYIREIDHINYSDEFDWVERKKNELKIKLKVCEFCKYNHYCQWVWKEYGEIYWDEEFWL